jgi:hypothetical protein
MKTPCLARPQVTADPMAAPPCVTVLPADLKGPRDQYALKLESLSPVLRRDSSRFVIVPDVTRDG